MSKLNIANLITFSRIFGVAYLFWLMPFVTEKIQLLVVFLFTLIAFTDFLDGWLARRLKSVSELGKVLDPLADKILLLILLPLVSMGVIKPFPVFIIFAREFAVMGLRVLAAKHKFSVAASFSGKLKTAITLPICGILLVRPVVIEMTQFPLLLAPIVYLKRWMFNWPALYYESLIWIMVFVTIASFIDYIWKFIWQRQCAIHNNDTAKVKQALLTYIPNAFSLGNIVCGAAAIIFAFSGSIKSAGAAILLGMIFDGLDGRIARKLNAFSKIGEKIDTTADYVTFGISPAIVLFWYLKDYIFLDINWAVISVPLLYYICVHFRLKRFELSGHEEFFTGLPSPIGALFCVASMYSVLAYYPWAFVGLNIVNMLLMASTLKYPHNEVAHKKPFFKYLKTPVLILICLVFVRFSGQEILGETVNNILLGLMTIYYSAPFIKTTER